MKKTIYLFLLLFLTTLTYAHATMTIGSKPFTENYLLAEMVAQIAMYVGEGPVDRKLGLGQSGFAFSALGQESIDIYPDYSDTIKLVLLKDPSLSTYASIQEALKNKNVYMFDPLGFSNTYVFAVLPSIAKQFALIDLSDLKKVPNIKAAFTEDFLYREDSYPSIAKAYDLSLKNIQTINHSLKYEALLNQQIELTDLYSTDAKLSQFDLVRLQDTLNVVPRYQATFLTRLDFAKKYPKTFAYINKNLVGQLSEEVMIKLNAKVDLEKVSIQNTVSAFLSQMDPDIDSTVESKNSFSVLYSISRRSWEHLILVGISMFASTWVGLLLGLWALESVKLRQWILGTTGMIQTMPSLALFAFLIAPFGIGWVPAVIALFLYALLPIVRNTYDGLASIDPSLIESAKALGLNRWQRLIKVEMPLASKTILGGIKTATIITIGTATLAALIGAGGYGVPIVSGLALNQMDLIMQGAIPAALMAIVAHGLFEWFEHIL